MKRDFTIVLTGPGIYTLAIEKYQHAGLTVSGLKVDTAGLDLRKNPLETVQVLRLPYGDLNTDGWIRFDDRDLLTNFTRFAGTVTAETEPYDLNGDGYINHEDLNILTLPEHFGKGGQTIVLTGR